MREKRFSRLDLVRMPTNEWRMLAICLEVGAFDLLGLEGVRSWRRDAATGDLVIVHEGDA